MSSASTETNLQVLEFRLEDRNYCVDIAHIDEIVNKGDDLTPLPNSESHVEGLVDLRGTTTTIVNPKVLLNLEGEGDGSRVIVFTQTDENRTTGWVIDEVNEVIRIDDEDVDDSVEGDSINGIVKKDGEFIVWVDPESMAT